MNKEGRVISINKSLHKVLVDDKIYDSYTRGKLRKENIVPLVGDKVIIDINNNIIEKVLERKNSLIRPLVANIDKLLIVSSTTIPSFSTYLIDKFLIMSYLNNIEPIIIITKIDMLKIKEKFNIKKYIKYYKKIGIKVYTNTNLNKIKKEFKNSLVALAGQTGAGKSTLLNRIDKKLSLNTDKVSLSLGRGKHTTRLVELIKINDGLVADTPGFSSLELNINKNDIKKYYKEFNEDCKYKSCNHVNEDGCKIKNKINKTIPKWRYDNYIKFLNETK